MNELAMIGVSLLGLFAGILLTTAAAIIAARAGLGVGGTVVVAVLGVILTILLPSLIPLGMGYLIDQTGLPIESMLAAQSILGLLWPITMLVLALIPWPATKSRA